MDLNYLEVEDIIRRALTEDIGSGDITTALTIPTGSMSRARIVAKERGVIAGVGVTDMVFTLVSRYHGIGTQDASAGFVFTPEVADGARVEPGDVIAWMDGPTAVILTGERVALNLIQRMSGIATKTAAMVSLVSHTKAAVVDTRKTTPGLRILEKYAVRAGGGRNHRFGLYDAVLIKDNHIQAAGGVKEAILAARMNAPHTIKVEIETDTLDQVQEALDCGADMILLDNMSPDTMRQAVAMCSGRALTEASGNISENTIAAVAESGVDIISSGALTHSVKSLDISLDIL